MRKKYKRKSYNKKRSYKKRFHKKKSYKKRSYKKKSYKKRSYKKRSYKKRNMEGGAATANKMFRSMFKKPEQTSRWSLERRPPNQWAFYKDPGDENSQYWKLQNTKDYWTGKDNRDKLFRELYDEWREECEASGFLSIEPIEFMIGGHTFTESNIEIGNKYRVKGSGEVDGYYRAQSSAFRDFGNFPAPNNPKFPELFQHATDSSDDINLQEIARKDRYGADFQITHIKRICKDDNPEDWELGDEGVKFYLVDNTNWIRFYTAQGPPESITEALKVDDMSIQYIGIMYAGLGSPVARETGTTGWYLGEVVLTIPKKRIYSMVEM